MFFFSFLSEAKLDQLSKEATELFPQIFTGSFLTLSQSIISKCSLTGVIGISKSLHDIQGVETVMHIQTKAASTEESFNMLADAMENMKQSGKNVLIACEDSIGTAATLAIPHAVKYQSMSVRQAKQLVLKKRKTLDLDQPTLIKLLVWEKKLRRVQFCEKLVKSASTHLPVMSVFALLCFALRLFQDEIERQHQLEKQTPEYPYFDILRWP